MKTRIKHVDLNYVKTVINSLKSVEEAEVVPVEDSLGHVLAMDIKATVNNPPHDIAHFDGYAVRFSDVENASFKNPVKLEVLGDVYAGEYKGIKVGKNKTVYVATGAYLPPNADTVIPVEAVKILGKLIEVRQSPPYKGWHVIFKGKDFRVGEVLFRKGKVIRPIDIEVMKLLGIDYVKVLRRLKVSLISVGDELVLNKFEVHESKKISTRHILVKSFLKKLNIDVIDLGVVGDNLKEIKQLLRNGLKISDIVVTIGGASVGKKDLVHEVIESLGKPGVIFHGIKVKPGRQTGFAIVNNTPIVMLPGLVQSTYVGMHVVLAPLIRKKSGGEVAERCYLINAEPVEGIEAKEFAGFIRLVFAEVISYTGNAVKVKPYLKESFSYTPIIGGDVALILPQNKVYVKPGEILKAIPLECLNWLDSLLLFHSLPY